MKEVVKKFLDGHRSDEGPLHLSVQYCIKRFGQDNGQCRELFVRLQRVFYRRRIRGLDRSGAVRIDGGPVDGLRTVSGCEWCR